MDIMSPLLTGSHIWDLAFTLNLVKQFSDCVTALSVITVARQAVPNQDPALSRFSETSKHMATHFRILHYPSLLKGHCG